MLQHPYNIGYGASLKTGIKSTKGDYVLLFDEMYTDLYRITEAENWMKNASKIIFMGTSFSVNITSIALRIAISRGLDVDIVDPEPIKLDYENIEYFNMTAVEYCNMRNLKS